MRRDDQLVALVARVLGELVEAGRGHLDRPAAHPRRAPPAARRSPLDRGVSAPGLVRRARPRRRVAAGRHGSRGEPPGKISSLGGATTAPGASLGRSGASGGGSANRGSSVASSSAGSPPRWPRTRPRRSETSAGRRPGPRGTARASPCSRSRARPHSRESSATGWRDAEPLQRRCQILALGR